MATKIEGWQHSVDGDLTLRVSVESNMNSMILGMVHIPGELIDDLIAELQKHASSEGDSASFVIAVGTNAKTNLGERSEPPTALLGEAASTEKSEGICLKKEDAEHFAGLLDEMIPDLINDRPKWMYHIGGMKTLRDQLRGVKTESGLA